MARHVLGRDSPRYGRFTRLLPLYFRFLIGSLFSRRVCCSYGMIAPDMSLGELPYA